MLIQHSATIWVNSFLFGALFKGSLGITIVKLLPCDQKVTGSSCGNNLLQKCRIKLRIIDPCGTALPRIPQCTRFCYIHTVTGLHTHADSEANMHRNYFSNCYSSIYIIPIFPYAPFIPAIETHTNRKFRGGHAYKYWQSQ